MQSGSLYSDVWSCIFFEAGFIPIWWYSWSINGTFFWGNLELLNNDKKSLLDGLFIFPESIRPEADVKKVRTI